MVGPVAWNITVFGPSVVRVPAARDRFFRIAGLVHAARQAPALDDDVKHDLEIALMEVLDHPFRIGEIPLVPGELAVPGVPSGRGELRSRIDEGVAREPLLPHRPGAPRDLVRAG